MQEAEGEKSVALASGSRKRPHSREEDDDSDDGASPEVKERKEKDDQPEKDDSEMEHESNDDSADENVEVAPPRSERIAECYHRLIFPSASSIPLVVNNPHILLNGGSINDPSITRNVLHRLMMAMHARQCTFNRREMNFAWPQHCKVPSCDYMRTVFEHLETCLNHNCYMDGCQIMRLLMGHWDNCLDKQNCNLCATYMRAMRTVT